MNEDLRARVIDWIARDPDEDDRATLQALLDQGDETELARRFQAPLRFGTAGLRGPVMAGPAGMNRLTVRRATQGVVSWLKEIGVDTQRGVVVGRDARHGSEKFNDEVVAVLIGAGVVVHEMPRPLPTPFVPFAVRALGAAAGIMVTASHNPPLDNGYKLYGPDGIQIIAPNDEIVERHMATTTVPLLGRRNHPLHREVAPALLREYREHMVRRFGTSAPSTLAIAYTPLHGVGGATMMELFAAAGFSNVRAARGQFVPDPNFPTLPFPNPEEPGALDLAMATADEMGASLVIANDPDADRLGAAVRGPAQWRVLRGDEIGWLLGSVLLDECRHADDVVATTIVSSSLLGEMARARGVRCVTTLTGFKWIGRAAGEGVLQFGYEEALGFAVDPLVGDKDGLSAALALAKLAHDLATSGQSLLDRLDELESTYGVHAGAQLSIRAQGPTGLDQLRAVVDRLRATPPRALAGLEVTEVVDLSLGSADLAPTDGIMWRLGAWGRVTIRPSGTEPKLKAYLEVTPPTPSASLDDARAEAQQHLDAVVNELRALLTP